jgi:hypothetical protein
VGAADGHADARGQCGLAVVRLEGASEDGFADAVGEENGVLQGAPRQRQQKFIFPSAADKVVAAELAAKAVGKLDEDAVAGFVSVALIDTREVVEVEQHQAERGLHALNAVGLLEDEAEEGFAVPEPGQAIMRDVVAQLGGLFLHPAGQGDDALGDSDPNFEVRDVQVCGAGGEDEKVIATALKGGANPVIAGAVAQQDRPGATLLLTAANFPQDFHRRGPGEVHIENCDGGRGVALEAGERVGSGLGDLNLIVPGLQGSSQIFNHPGIGAPEQDDGAGAHRDGVDRHEDLPCRLYRSRGENGLRKGTRWRDFGHAGARRNNSVAEAGAKLARPFPFPEA